MITLTDEGIRWAVASEILFWWTRLYNPKEAKKVALKLLKDVHPWVVRETLQQLANDPYICQAIGLDLLLENAEDSLEIFHKQGWGVFDSRAAKMRIASFKFAMLA